MILEVLDIFFDDLNPEKKSNFALDKRDFFYSYFTIDKGTI